MREPVSIIEDSTVVKSGWRELPASTLGKPLVSVVITTKNRKDELREAVHSALSQSVSVEVFVIDDGSTDGTAEMIREEFPLVRLERSETSLGYIVQRNRAAHLASGDVIFSIDDDAIFTSPYTVAQTLAEFDHPRVGAVAIPFVEPRKSATLHQRAPSRSAVYVTDYFIGTAHALRKDLFLRLHGYQEFIFHQGEELDFCLRMLQAGYVVRLGSADPIHHLESPKRDFRRMDFYGRRNDILFAWHNVPMPYLPLHLLATSVNGLWSGLKARRPSRMLLGGINGWWTCIARWRHRQPVGVNIYLLSRRLKKCGPLTLNVIEPLLPPLEKSDHDSEFVEKVLA